MTATVPAPHPAARPLRYARGLTILELLVALAVLGIVFTMLAQSQVLNLRQTARQQDFTEVKGTAIRELERISSDVLRTEQVTNPLTGAVSTRYYFAEYRDACLSATSTDTRCASASNANPRWRIQAETSSFGSDVLLISVTSTGTRGTRYTVAQRVSCYDIYPAPSRDTPQPCTEQGGS